MNEFKIQPAEEIYWKLFSLVAWIVCTVQLGSPKILHFGLISYFFKYMKSVKDCLYFAIYLL